MKFKFKDNKGFSIIELLIVIAIIGYLSSVVIGNISEARNKAYYVRGKKELNTIHEALQLYLTDNKNVYPADVARGLPNGLEKYLPAGSWPSAPWPETLYDWDVWDDPASSKDIVQISIRFCKTSSLSSCSFPKESWSKDFGVNSALYYCIKGACRSHIAEPVTYPGKCINCTGTSTSVD